MTMKKRAHRHCLFAGQVIISAVALVTALPGWAQTLRVVTIEEHWELSVGEPREDQSAPQTSLVMSPTGGLSGPYFVFTLNHHSLPSYLSGGMQVQLWDGDAAVEEHAGAAEGTLAVANETIHWVQRLAIDDGALTFEIVDGASQTWGAFGGSGDLTLSTPTSLTDLIAYRPAVSLTESEVGYAGNRVVSLILKKLVWQTEDGESHELHAPIDIDADLDP